MNTPHPGTLTIHAFHVEPDLHQHTWKVNWHIHLPDGLLTSCLGVITDPSYAEGICRAATFWVINTTTALAEK